MSFGVTQAGFRAKRLPDALAELQAALRVAFGPDLNLDADSALGQLAGVLARAEAEIWELLAAAYHSQYRAWAEAEHLDAVGALLALPRGDGEGDIAYRRRLRLLPESAGRSTADALRAAVLAVEGVISATVLTPDDTPPDTEGDYYQVPDHRFEVVAEYDDEDEEMPPAIARAIWDHKPAGVEPWAAPGDTRREVILDVEEEDPFLPLPRTVMFSRPKLRAIRVSVFVMDPAGAAGLPSNWKDTLRAGILALGNTHGVGENVVGQRFFEPVFAVPEIRQVILAVVDIENVENSWNSTLSTGDGTLEIAPGERAVFSEVNVLLTP